MVLKMAFSRLSSSSRFFRPKPPFLEIGKELSRGAYGSVHCGRLDGKDVAIKRLHGLLLEAARGQGDLDTMLRDFRRECDLLERVDHPHVVGFKGSFYDETTDEPILVMELMTENLRQYLERNRGQLNRQKQLAICAEIVRGLHFLHTRSPPIVHRDLTDKNILLDADGVVKIGDLGQSKLKTADYFSTGQPGAIPFMSPEAMQEQSHYNEKLDLFSLGVFMLEVATQQPPRVGMVGIGVTPELQRRREDLSKLDEDHPLRPLILSCLNDNPKERPDIVAVHTQLLAMVEGDKLQTVQSTASRPTQEVCSPTSGSELQTVQSTTSGSTHRVCSLSSSSESGDVVYRGSLLHLIQQTLLHCSSCNVFQTTSLLREGHTLHSEKLPDLRIDTACATAVVIDGKVYVCGGRCRDAKSGCLVHVYNFDEKKWSTLPTPAPQYRCEAIAFNNQLVLMGGREASSFKITNIISTWTGDCWQNELPAMPVKRLRPGIILYRKYIIAAGGMSEHNRALLSSVDILDTSTRQWWTPINFQLPKPMYALSVTTSSSYLYVAAAIVDYGITNNLKTPSNEAWQLPVDVLEDVLTTKGDNARHHWTVIAPTPYNHSTLLKGNTHPLAIGGSVKRDQSGSSATCHICAYDHVRNQWSSVGQLQEPRARCAVVCVNESSFLVCGGYSDTAKDPQPRISSVELLTVHR